jgi:glutamyl-tRNA reductase
VLLIGAGEMGELVARHMVSMLDTGCLMLDGRVQHSASVNVRVCNRSYDRAVKLANKIGASPAPFEDLVEHLVDADVVISCTASPGYIISTEQLRYVMDKRSNRPKGNMIIIDIAVPRDVEAEAGKLENVYLYNIDNLQSIADEGLKQRQSALSDAEMIVKEKVDVFLRWLNSSSVTPAIKSLTEKAATIRDEELTKALSKLGELTEREEKIIRSMAKSIVSRLIATPINQLKEHAGTDQGHLHTQVARSLLGLSVEEEKSEDEVHKDRYQRQRVGALAD